MIEKFRRFENLHILFWLIKDASWVSDYKVLGVCMIAPTLLMSFFITWKLREELGELAHNLAVTCWIIANSIWMIGEFYYDDKTREPAKIFFYAGLAILAIYYLNKGISMLKARSQAK